MGQLNAIYEGANFSDAPPVKLEDMSIYGVDGSATQIDNTIQQDQETGIGEILPHDANMLSFN